MIRRAGSGTVTRMVAAMSVSTVITGSPRLSLRGACGAALPAMFGLMLACGLQAGAAQAQQLQQPEAEVSRAADTATALQQLRGEVRQGRALLDLDCPKFSFADVLASPDNILLNTCYARQQISEGNVRGSAATLERVLLIAPDRADVRLLYAIVLFRLDSVDEAEREFKAVQAVADLPASLEEEVNAYLGEIEKRRKRTKHVVSLSFGTHYDTNRNSAPMSERTFALGTLTDVQNEEDRPEEDFGLLGVVNYSVTHDPGFEDPHELIGSISYVVDDQINRDDLDLHAFTAEPGIRFRFPGVTVTPKLHYSLLELSREKFFTGYGGSMDVGWRTDWANELYSGSLLADLFGETALGSVDMNLRGRYVHEKYSNTFDLATLTLRTGNKANVEYSAAFNLTPEHRVGGRLGLEVKSASGDSGNSDAETFSYRYYTGALNHTWAIGSGKFLATEASVGLKEYRNPDPLVLASNRRLERPYKLRSTFGLPMTEITDLHWLNKRWAVTNAVRGFLAQSSVALTGEYLWQNSNINNYQYKNAKAQALLTRRFEF